MTILPVLDILEGQVVRGIAGQRSEYRPIVSRLTSSSDPIEVAQAIHRAYGLRRFYLADLDAILNQRPNLKLYPQLIEDGFELLVDAGIRGCDDAANVHSAGVTGLVVGLETCRSPGDLDDICRITDDVVFGLDLFLGKPRTCTDSNDWNDDPCEIVRQAVASGVKAVLPLDLSDVGMGTGGSTDSICRQIRTEFPSIRLIAGGGVRGRDDLIRIRELGVDEILIASALHDGRLGPNDVRI